jgi:hypothetical protein
MKEIGNETGSIELLGTVQEIDLLSPYLLG